MRSSLWRYAAATGLTLTVMTSTGCGKRSVGSVNGEKITQDTFYKRLQRFPISPQIQFPPPMGQQAATTVLASLSMEQLILQQAEKLGVMPDQKQIDERKRELNGALTDRGRTLGDLLQQSGITHSELDDRLRPELAQINILQSFVKISDAKVREAYNEATSGLKSDEKYKSAFYLPQSVKLFVILTKSEKKINDAARQLKSGITFQTVAEQLSDDPNTKQKRGEIGWVEKPDLIRRPLQGVPEAIYTKAFQLKEKEVSAPFKTGTQWVILKAEALKPARMQPFDHVKGIIKDRLLNDQGRNNPKAKALYEKMMKDAKVEVNLPGYKEFFKNYWTQMQKAQTPTVGTQRPPAGGEN